MICAFPFFQRSGSQVRVGNDWIEDGKVLNSLPTNAAELMFDSSSDNRTIASCDEMQ